MYEPAIDLLPLREWSRIAGRHLNRAQPSVLLGRDRLGFSPLRKAIASYLGSSRGVACDPDQIFILSGVQQCLDVIARVLLKPGRGAWVEDPGYFGALLAFQNAGAKILPVPVDEEGLNPSKARGKGKVAYVTPAHQFPTGVTMSARRRLDVLSWARRSGCYLIEDDYDSEYRFGSAPVPCLKSFDDTENVILVGSFNKLMFSALRIGYIVAPPALVAPLAALRYAIDLNTFGVEQAILADFIEDGALGRHLRRMREAYGNRFAALQESCRIYLNGALELSNCPAGLFVPAMLRNGMNSQQAEQAALEQGIESLGIHRFALRSKDRNGILLGFGAFEEKRIRAGVITLAKALT
jgi:GntR family transcriptional regulator/MocR family aminotransferase